MKIFDTAMFVLLSYVTFYTGCIALLLTNFRDWLGAKEDKYYNKLLSRISDKE